MLTNIWGMYHILSRQLNRQMRNFIALLPNALSATVERGVESSWNDGRARFRARASTETILDLLVEGFDFPAARL